MINKEISLVFQRHLLNPLYCGPGRWIIVNACSKKHYLWVGKDTIDLSTPSINQVLSEFDEFENISSSEIFKTFYQRYVLDFPFEDYFNPKWKENDLKTMKAYTKISEPPLKSLKFKHNILLKSKKEGVDRLDSLFKLLQYTFGIQRIDNERDFGPWFKKTSPSGGSIHPSECFVYIPNSYVESITSGIYHYNFVSEELHLLHNKDVPSSIKSFNSEILTIFCVLDLKRVQFRYRTPRSWRPALIDTGHILYSLQISAKSIGLNLNPYIPIQTDIQNVSSLDLPMVFAAEIGNKSDQTDFHHINTTIQKGETYFTNPFSFLFKTRKKWYAAVVFPKESILEINNIQLQLLTYLQYSRREDRKRMGYDILEIFNISKDELTILKSNHLLVTESAGLFWTSVINSSCHNGWYLSMLENAASRQKERFDFQSINIQQSDAELLFNLGLKRKTCRSFKNIQVETNLFKILGQNLTKLIRSNEDWNEIEIFYFAMTDENSSIYKINIEGVMRMKKMINRSIIRNIAIGQEWSCEASIGFYLVSTQSNEQSLKFPCIKLGQFAQALILSVLKYELDSFMTPALKDIELQSILYDDIKPSRIPYFIAIGYEK